VAEPIPQNDLQAGYRAHRHLIDVAMARVAASGWYILGREVAEFEQRFAAYLGAAAGIGVASGTDAVEVALRACGVGAGDVVFTVPHTAAGTIVGIERAGAQVVLVDVDRDTYTICPRQLAAAIRSHRGQAGARPAAIVPVHLYGQLADMPAIGQIARQHGLRIVEDCAQAHGASLEGRKAGTWGDAAAFSFYPTKNLGALGDAGMVVTSDQAVAQSAREIRQYGWRDRHVSCRAGINSRLDELQAAILSARLTELDADNERRRQIAGQYTRALADTGLQLPHARPGGQHVYHQYVVQTGRRDSLRHFLQQRGIGTAIHYPDPIHQQPAYAGRLAGRDELPASQQIAERIVSLPMHPRLTDRQVETVAAAIHAWHRQAEQ